MNKVILVAGPRGAGKSTYCRRCVEECPDVGMVSRDDIIRQLAGTLWLDPYTSAGVYYEASYRMFEQLRRMLAYRFSAVLIDHWSSSACERRRIARKLRLAGAHSVAAWYFQTPLEQCVQWFTQRECPDPGSDKRAMFEHMCRHDHPLFHRLAYEDLGDGRDLDDRSVFSSIQCINPLQRTLFPGVFPL